MLGPPGVTLSVEGLSVQRLSRWPHVCACRLYWHIGKRNFGPNAVNIGAALFMWTILPGFAAAAYTPTLVQERVLFYRCLPAYTACHQQ